VAKKTSKKSAPKPLRRRLAVRWRKQKEPFYCGPACIQMVLGHLKVSRSQNELFEDVVSSSQGERPVDAVCEPERACYQAQVCDLCGSTWECWDTDPDALVATLNANAPPGVVFSVHYPGEFEEGARMLIDSLRKPAKPAPAITTILSVNHWVVVNGYELEDPGTLESDADGTAEHPPINGLYLLDPREIDADQRVRLVTITEWMERFGLIECGEHEDRYVVIVKE